ncbi:MAG: hypothetical protein A7315_12840 [Candidatus Altiarchaeales archaeon WOR_SM1_79]|nr:MAG: hypothetical protein A7315_12840 [Candidatus Altiarchaeales archaeon WOR_SM1_79]
MKEKKVLTIKQSHHQNSTFLDMRQTIACLFDYEITNVILFGLFKQNYSKIIYAPRISFQYIQNCFVILNVHGMKCHPHGGIRNTADICLKFLLMVVYQII